MTINPPYPAPVDIAIASLFFNCLFVALRTWARILQNTKWMWADVLVPFSLVSNLTHAALIIHLYIALDVKSGRSTESNKFSAFAIPLVGAVAIALPKLAVIDVYLRIFATRWAKWVLLGTAFVISANSIALIFATIFQCRRIQAIWDQSIHGDCNDIKAQFNYSYIPNVVTDVVLIMVPIPIIARLQMDWNVKAGVLVTFLSGLFGLVASSVRLAMFIQWTPQRTNIDPINIASLFEITAYLAVACLLHMRPLVNRIRGHKPLRRYFTSWSARYRTTTRGSTTGISSKERRMSRRLPSVDGSSSVGGLVNTDVESDGGIYVLQTVAFATSDGANKAFPQMPPAVASMAHVSGGAPLVD